MKGLMTVDYIRMSYYEVFPHPSRAGRLRFLQALIETDSELKRLDAAAALVAIVRVRPDDALRFRDICSAGNKNQVKMTYLNDWASVLQAAGLLMPATTKLAEPNRGEMPEDESTNQGARIE